MKRRFVQRLSSPAALARFAAYTVFAVAAAGGVACRSQADAATSAASASTEVSTSAHGAQPAGKLQVVAAPAQGTAESVVQATLASARAEGRTLVVYVGATWCEPCQHFHQAAERGDLDAAFPRMTLLTFDLDRDRERLAAAGYVSKYIPLFALPGPDGAASGKQIEGGIKGDGAVGNISSRLTEMLAQ
jgi:hypothetical protein